jgi:hypothetical protein
MRPPRDARPGVQTRVRTRARWAGPAGTLHDVTNPGRQAF